MTGPAQPVLGLATAALTLRRTRELFCGVLLSLASVACGAAGMEGEAAGRDMSLSDDDRAAVADADRAYADAWLANDADSILATLGHDAVIIPSGMAAIEGPQAIRDFWFPPDSPATTVGTYDLIQTEIDGSADLAFVRGSFTLTFDYDGDTYESEGTYLSLLRRETDGNWRIARRTWNDHRRD